MRSKFLRMQVALLTALSLIVASCSDYTSTKPNSPNGGNGGQNTPTTPSKPDAGTDPNAAPFSEENMLKNISMNVMARAASDFAAQAPALKTSVRQYCEALANGSSARREEAQAKADWERAMFAYHQVEAVPLPLKDKGEYLAANLYFWPYLNTCEIDKAVVKNAESPVDGSRALHNTKGLAALEYLLFENTLTSSCNMRANPQMQEWNERPAAQKKLERCLWAQELMNDVEAKAQQLGAKFDVAGENYGQKIVNNPKGAKEAINALSDSIILQAETIKDAKLGVPMGRYKGCSYDKCPEQVEHKYSGASLASAEATLKGLRAIFTGSFSTQPAHGLDDLLAKAGRQDVADKLIQAIDRSLASLQKAQDSGTLKEQIEAMDAELCKSSTKDNRQVEICAVHADFREVAFLLKTEFLAALALRAPPTHQGDND